MDKLADRSQEIRDFIIYHIEKHPKDIGKQVAEKMGVSRVTATKYLKDLQTEHILESSGQTKARVYALKKITKNFNFDVTPELEEDVIWSRDIRPELEGLKENILEICGHGVTEMINNVISHSESTNMHVSLDKTSAKIAIIVRDFGMGIFKKIKDECHLSDLHHAVLEIAKGKLTTDKDNHSGEGIFFTSRMMDDFALIANGLSFMRSEENNDWLLEGGKDLPGTAVRMTIHTNATRTAEETFNKYRDEFNEFGFSKTIIPLSLMTYGDELLISRSQAKRVMSRAERFRHIVLDFKGVSSIGQAFADEIFRVYAKQHPLVKLNFINSNEAIEQMIMHVLANEKRG